MYRLAFAMKMILPRDFFPPFSSKDHRRRDYTFDNTFGLEAPRSQGKGGYMTFETCSSAFNHVNSPFVGRRDFHLRIRHGLSRKDFFVPLRFAQTRLDEEEGHILGLTRIQKSILIFLLFSSVHKSNDPRNNNRQGFSMK